MKHRLSCFFFFAECLRQDKHYFNLYPRPSQSKRKITNKNNKIVEVAISENDVFQMVCQEEHCAAACSDTVELDSDTEMLDSDTEDLDSKIEKVKVGGKSKGLGAGIPGMSLSHTTSSTSKPVSALGKRKSNKPNCFVSETKPLKKRTRTKRKADTVFKKTRSSTRKQALQNTVLNHFKPVTSQLKVVIMNVFRDFKNRENQLASVEEQQALKTKLFIRLKDKIKQQLNTYVDDVFHRIECKEEEEEEEDEKEEEEEEEEEEERDAVEGNEVSILIILFEFLFENLLLFTLYRY